MIGVNKIFKCLKLLDIMKSLWSKFKRDKEFSEEDTEIKELLGEHYKNYSIYPDALIYKSGFNPIRSFKKFIQSVYHPSNYRR